MSLFFPPLSGEPTLGKKLDILLLEDMDSDAELVEHELRKVGIDFLLRRVDTREDFLRELERYLGRDIVRTVVCNDRRPPEGLLKRYAAEGAEFVEIDLDGKRIRRADVLGGRDLARHDPEKIARVLMSL